MKYTESHEWVRVEGEVATIGITHHAQKELGDIVYVELPETGSQVSRKDDFVVLESTKMASGPTATTNEMKSLPVATNVVNLTTTTLAGSGSSNSPNGNSNNKCDNKRNNDSKSTSTSSSSR